MKHSFVQKGGSDGLRSSDLVEIDGEVCSMTVRGYYRAQAAEDVLSTMSQKLIQAQEEERASSLGSFTMISTSASRSFVLEGRRRHRVRRPKGKSRGGVQPVDLETVSDVISSLA
jgi:hypothetical protein